MSLHIVYHPTWLAHDPGPGHPESPARLKAILAELRSPAWTDRLTWHEALPADDEALSRVHTPEYLRLLAEVSARGGGRLDEDTMMTGVSWDAARLAAGAAIQVARLALEGHPAFAPTRPPGHHATGSRAMGFCLLNNVVVAARAMIAEAELERVLIIDWDVHHGNGTQDLVEDDVRIRYVSLHQWPLYPGTGREDERGVGNIFNVPRPPGLPRAAYRRDLEAAVERATSGWVPQLILLSAGFDALAGDPLGGFTLEPADYAEWVTGWRRLGVPIASVLEGGYAPERVARAVGSHLMAMG